MRRITAVISFVILMSFGFSLRAEDIDGEALSPVIIYMSSVAIPEFRVIYGSLTSGQVTSITLVNFRQRLSTPVISLVESLYKRAQTIETFLRTRARVQELIVRLNDPHTSHGQAELDMGELADIVGSLNRDHREGLFVRIQNALVQLPKEEPYLLAVHFNRTLREISDFLDAFKSPWKTTPALFWKKQSLERTFWKELSIWDVDGRPGYWPARNRVWAADVISEAKMGLPQDYECPHWMKL